MRKMRYAVVAALIAVLGIATAAYAQTTTIQVNGSVSAHGGSKKHPKSGSLTFGFDVSSPGNVQPAPLKDYAIGFEGGRMNLNIMKSCTAAKINATNGGDDSKCPKGSKIGSGTMHAAVGGTGQDLGGAATCDANLVLYAAGKANATLFVDAPLSSCPAEIHEAIPMSYYTDKATDSSGLKFEVPDDLRHQLGLDVTVLSTKVTISKVTKTKKHVVRKHHHKKVKKVKTGLLESTGCKDGERSLVATFTDEAGTVYPVTQDLGKC